MTATNLDAFTLAYIEAALWSSMDESTEQGGEPLDANYTVDDIHPDTLASMAEDCADFQKSFGQFTADDESKAGHLFWLDRNGHGAGFWDGDYDDAYPEDRLENETDDQYEFRCSSSTHYTSVGDFLHIMSKPYGSFDLYIGDDGMVHGQ